MADMHAPHHALVFQFVGALLQRTLHYPTVAAHQQALHGFLDDRTPWLRPADLPTVTLQAAGCSSSGRTARHSHRLSRR